MNRRHKGLTTLASVLASLIGGTWWLLHRPLPRSRGRLTLGGLLEEVEIHRDRWGVPHIYAATTRDLFFAQGFVHAQDRLWQMEFQRRLAAGRLSEVLGKATLDVDRWVRTLGLYRTAQKSYAGLSDRARRALDAYAAGVNAFLESGHPLPVEFTLLRYRPEPWSPVDSLTWASMMALGLSTGWDAKIIRARLIQRLGPQRAATLEGGYPPDNPVILPEIDYAALGESALRRQATAGPTSDIGAGSNSWVVAGERSVTGKPLLANDPHLMLQIPGIWYENHLVGAGYNVIGASLPGLPSVIIGHNDRIAWGLTASMADVQDLYIERFHPDDPYRYQVNDTWQEAEVYREEIRVRGCREPVIHQVVVTRHGPIITDLAPGESQPLALRWVAQEVGDGTLEAFLRVNRARDWEEFRAALRHLVTPVLNWVYADVDGNIGYQLAGRIPVRRRGNGQVPVPGWTDEYEWEGTIPFDELPRSFNPPSGYIVTANNKPVGDDYPYFLGTGWAPGYRAQRITEMIERRATHDRESFQVIQTDWLSIPAQRIAQRLTRLWTDDPELSRALEILRVWDGQMHPRSVAATLAYTTLIHLRRRLFAAALGELADAYLGKGFHPLLRPVSGYAARSFEAAFQVLEDLDSPWLAGRSPDDVLQEALHDAVAELRARFGPDMASWRWGRVNRLTLVHPLGTVRPLGRLFNRGPYEVGGDPFSPWPNAGRYQAYYDYFHSASYRLIVDLSDLTRSVSVMFPGQSGHPGSPHYANQIDDWLLGRYHPLLWEQEAVREKATDMLTLIPESQRISIGPISEGSRMRGPTTARATAVVRQWLQVLPRARSRKPTLPPELDYEAPNSELSYTMHWLKTTWEWDAGRRQAVAEAVARIMARPDFDPNPTERRYQVPGLEGCYSGLSLVALARVLRSSSGNAEGSS